MPTLKDAILSKQLSAITQAYSLNNLARMLEWQEEHGFFQFNPDLAKASIEINEPELGITISKGSVTLKDVHNEKAWERLAEIYDEHLSQAAWYIPYGKAARDRLISELDAAMQAEPDSARKKQLQARRLRCITAEEQFTFAKNLNLIHPDYSPPVFDGLSRPMKVLGNFGVNPAVDSVVFSVRSGQLVLRAIERPGDTPGSKAAAFVGGMGQGIDKVIDEILEEYYSGALFKVGSGGSLLLDRALKDSKHEHQLLAHILKKIGDFNLPDDDKNLVIAEMKKVDFTTLESAGQIRELADALIGSQIPALKQLAAHILVEAYKNGLPKQYAKAANLFKDKLIKTEEFPNTADRRNTDDAYMATSMFILFAENLAQQDAQLAELGLRPGAGDDALAVKIVPFGEFIDDAFTNHGPMAIRAFSELLQAGQLSEHAKQFGMAALADFLQKNPLFKLIAELEATDQKSDGQTLYAKTRNILAFIHKNKGIVPPSTDEAQSFGRLTALYGEINRKETPKATVKELKADMKKLEDLASKIQAELEKRSQTHTGAASLNGLFAQSHSKQPTTHQVVLAVKTKMLPGGHK